MFQTVLETVLGKFTFDIVAGATHSGSVRASTLDHEAIDNAMEDQAVIEALLYQADKIIYSIGSNLRI